MDPKLFPLSPRMKIWQFREPFWLYKSIHRMKTIDLFFDCSQKQALKKYISEMHEEGKKPFKCDICDQSFFKRAICQNTLLLSMILTNHSSVIFVTKFFCKEQFKETYCWCSWKEEKIWMSLCNQNISLKKPLKA